MSSNLSNFRGGLKARMRILLERPVTSESTFTSESTLNGFGGVDVFIAHIVPVLEEAGVTVDFCDASYFHSLKNLDCYLEKGQYDIFLPLGWHDYHRYPIGYLPKFLDISVKIWYDISPLCPFYGVDPQDGTSCKKWFLKTTDCRTCWKRKGALHRPPTGGYVTNSKTNVLLSRLPFDIPRAWVVPWAASHIPACDLRDPHGCILVLAGKIPAKNLEKLVHAASEIAPLRIVFSHWAPFAKECKDSVNRLSKSLPLEVIPYYILPEDLVSTFGGVSVAILPIKLYETFGLLGLELIRCGIPVVSLSSAGNVRTWSSRVFSCVDDLVLAIRKGELSGLVPISPPLRTWRDVGADLLKVFANVKEA
jgi:glycosyltransferase involved in cell wall biosynthesis